MSASDAVILLVADGLVAAGRVLGRFRRPCESESRAKQEFGRLHGLESGGEALEPGAYVPPHGIGCRSCDGDITTCDCWVDDDDDDEAVGPGGRFYRKPEPVEQQPAFDRDAYQLQRVIAQDMAYQLDLWVKGHPMTPERRLTVDSLLAADKRIAERLDGAK